MLTFAPKKNKLLLIMDLKKRIKALGWTQERLAAEMTDRTGKKGITQSALGQMLNGDPSISRVQQIADIIGVPLSELVADDTNAHHQVCPHCGKPIKITLE